MDPPKDTEEPTEKQAPNNLYGRIPRELLPQIRELSNLEARIFMVLSVLANFKREPLGEVCANMSEIAREVGIDRKSLWRGMKPLFASGLVAQGHTGCVLVPHYLWPDAAPPVAQGHTESPQPQQNTTTYEPPIGSEEVSEKEVKRKKATTSVSKAKKGKGVSRERVVRIQWDGQDFVGDRLALREKLYEKYDDLGKSWINAIWSSIIEWCEEHPDEMKAKKDCWLFVLGWYMRDAKKERTKKW